MWRVGIVPFLWGQLKAATDTCWIQTFKTQTESPAEQDIFNLKQVFSWRGSFDLKTVLFINALNIFMGQTDPIPSK